MPSSISNSSSHVGVKVASGATVNARLPNLAYGRLWAWTSVSLVLLVIMLEILLPAQGYSPSVSDSKALWAINRAAVYPQGNKNTLVILGSSRSQLGVVPEVLAQRLENYRIIDLAVNATAAPATFADLASDPDFVGTIVLDIDPSNMFATSQQPWVDYYRQEWFHAGRVETIINTQIQVFLQSRFVFTAAQFRFKELVWTRNLRPSYLQGQANRYLPAYYYVRLTASERAENLAGRIERTKQYYRDEPSLSPTEFVATLAAEYGPLIAQLRARGGEVIFLHMPISGEVEEIVDAAYPQADYCDAIAPTLGVPTVHYRDAEGLRGFVCPDGSHLDAADARVFTANLADELIRRGIVSQKP